MKTTLLTLAASAVLATVATAADGTSLSYNNIGAGYEYTNLDEAGFDDADGAFIDISLSPIDHLYIPLRAGFGTAGSDFDVDFDYANFSVGIGSWVALDPGDRLHLVLEANAVFLNYDVDSGLDELDDFSDDEFGGQFRLGLRGAITDRLEVNVFAFDTFTSEENNFGISAGLVLGVFDFLAITADAAFIEDQTNLRAGLRLNW